MFLTLFKKLIHPPLQFKKYVALESHSRVGHLVCMVSSICYVELDNRMRIEQKQWVSQSELLLDMSVTDNTKGIVALFKYENSRLTLTLKKDAFSTSKTLNECHFKEKKEVIETFFKEHPLIAKMFCGLCAPEIDKILIEEGHTVIDLNPNRIEGTF